MAKQPAIAFAREGERERGGARAGARPRERDRGEAREQTGDSVREHAARALRLFAIRGIHERVGVARDRDAQHLDPRELEALDLAADEAVRHRRIAIHEHGDPHHGSTLQASAAPAASHARSVSSAAGSSRP